ncbi:MAG: DNA repair protein RecN [Pseudomonadales bacterium]|nr:DNA repair protein RecN [Pseudomonadales bacterium]
MLQHLSIRNFAIVDQLDIEYSEGLTAITGETGAGKSITLDALSLALGDRADSSVVPETAERADITASFDINGLTRAALWLEQRDLANSTDECLLRRVITREGRSRAYINGHPATLQQLRELGEMLIDIHSQHEHQSLLQKENHRHLLDSFAGSTALAATVEKAYQSWKEKREQLQALYGRNQEDEARIQLLRYQLDELGQLNLEAEEFRRLEAEQKQLCHADELLSTGEQLLSLCGGSENDEPCLASLIRQALRVLSASREKTTHLVEAGQMLQAAAIQIEEAIRELSHHQQRVEVNPERLLQVEERLGTIFQLARKHRINPEDIPSFAETLEQELLRLNPGDDVVDLLEKEVEASLDSYTRLASALSSQRKKAAGKLSVAINAELQRLHMSSCQLKIDLQKLPAPSAKGGETVEFLVTTNPGQSAQPLRKIASGGELSRISLAIQVVTARHRVTPTLVFDEVDVGIGGETAVVVGELLRALGERVQVLCVTHQAVVAARAHQHLRVSKEAAGKRVKTALTLLKTEQRVEEIARMMGGAAHIEESRAHAQKMMA